MILIISGGIYWFKNNPNTKTICEITLKLTIRALGWRLWLSSGVFIVNLEQISLIVLAFEQC